jgi:hypothetical protein
MELIHPIVKKYCDNRDMGMALQKVNPREVGDVLHSGGVKNSGIRYSPTQALAFEAGLRERTVHDIYVGRIRKDWRSKNDVTGLKWTTVDKLLTAMDLIHLWFEEPLSEYYSPRPSPTARRQGGIVVSPPRKYIRRTAKKAA